MCQIHTDRQTRRDGAKTLGVPLCPVFSARSAETRTRENAKQSNDADARQPRTTGDRGQEREDTREGAFKGTRYRWTVDDRHARVQCSSRLLIVSGE